MGGSFALLAAARPRIRDRVAFVGAFAPFSSVSTLVRDIASNPDGRRNGDAVDGRSAHAAVFVRSVTCALEPAEADALRTAYEQGRPLDPPDTERGRACGARERGHAVEHVAELAAALAGRPGVRYTEYAMFEHADPTKRKLSPLRLAVEVRKFYLSPYPMFRQAVG